MTQENSASYRGNRDKNRNRLHERNWVPFFVSDLAGHGGKFLRERLRRSYGHVSHAKCSDRISARFKGKVLSFTSGAQKFRIGLKGPLISDDEETRETV
jgi:hypothetical protein